MRRADLKLLTELRQEYADMVYERAASEAEADERLNLIPKAAPKPPIVEFPRRAEVRMPSKLVRMDERTEDLMPFRDIARKLGCTTQAAHQSYVHGMHKLRKLHPEACEQLRILAVSRRGVERREPIYPDWYWSR